MRLIRTFPPLLLTLSLTLAFGAAAPGQDPVKEPARGSRSQEKDKPAEKGQVATRANAEAPVLFPEGYPDHDALSAALRKVAKAHPERVGIESLAKSSEGRDVWLVTLGKAEPKTKPAVLITANLEGDHVVGSVVALRMIEAIAEAKEADAAWLDRVTVYVVPRLNPDGAERTLGRVSSEFRTNLRPIDRDRDGRSGEDGPDDLNGDGFLTRMRVKDPKTASLVPDDKDPRILRKADATKGEKPVYAEESEGKDDDGDGLRDEDPAGGVNLNRNWPFRWSEFDLEAGASPASEPEVFALITFAFAHPEIAAVWSFSLNDNLRDEPKKPGSTLDDADLPLIADIVRAHAKAVAPKETPKGSSPAGKGSPAPGATTDGSISEWAYHQFGAVGLASRLWSTPEIPAPPAAPAEKEAEKKDATEKDQAKDKGKDQEKEKDKPKEKAAPAIPDDGEARWLYWNDHVVNGRAFLPFAPFDHPNLGKVEIGGWKPCVRLNPPASQTAAIAEGELAFLKDLAGKLPSLAIPEFKAVSKGGGLYEVSASVVNNGYLPTALAQGVRTTKGLPVLVRLDAGKSKILAGKALEQINALAGSGARREYRWLVQAPEGLKSIKLDVSCPRAGRARAEAELK